MPYTVTWDPDSKAEFRHWRQSGAADTATLACVVRLMTALVEGIAIDGPDPSATPHMVRRARDGADVAVYCHVEERAVVRCFGLCGDDLRLLVIGPFNSGTVLDLALERAERW